VGCTLQRRKKQADLEQYSSTEVYESVIADYCGQMGTLKDVDIMMFLLSRCLSNIIAGLHCFFCLYFMQISGNMFFSLSRNSLLNWAACTAFLTFRIFILRYGIPSFHQPIFIGTLQVGNKSGSSDSSPLYTSPFTHASQVFSKP
jgi:hypothetical protein